MKIHNLKVEYDGHLALDVAEFVFDQEGITAILGPNGSGKSTLLKALAGVIEVKEGQVEGRPEDMRYLPQKPYLFHRTVLQNVMLTTKDKNRALAVLDELAVLDYQGKSVRKLSGGEAQRVALARVMVDIPSVALLDEPASAADVSGALIIERFLKKCAFEGTGVIMTTHNPAAALRIADHAVMMWGGRIVEQGKPQWLLTRPQTEMTRRYIESWRT